MAPVRFTETPYQPSTPHMDFDQQNLFVSCLKQIKVEKSIYRPQAGPYGENFALGLEYLGLRTNSK